MRSTILKNLDRIPGITVAVLEEHVAILSGSLHGNLVGIYLHGSAAMGGFSWQQSDIDYIAVSSAPLNPTERRQISASFLENFGRGVPEKGVEMSIVLERFAGPDFCYPTPYEFHFGTEEQIRLHGSPHQSEMLDADLAAHFTIIKHRGVCIYGKPIDEVFADVPKKHYISSIVADAVESFRNIQTKTGDGMCRVPTYAVLNFCRVLAYLQEGSILSKLEGAEWGLTNIPSEFHPVILAARDEYIGVGKTPPVRGGLLKEFASYSQNGIKIETFPQGRTPNDRQ